MNFKWIIGSGVSNEQDMLAGYRDGHRSYSAEYPECHNKKSAAYKHGWLNGCSDRIGASHERAEVLRNRARMILGD